MCSLVGCAPSPRSRLVGDEGNRRERPSILLITVDALRADHLGLHGYHRPTSPHLDRLSGDSVVFERAYTTTPQTSYALTSLLTGGHALSLARLGVLEDRTTIAAALRAEGYRTAAFFPPAVFFADPGLFSSFERARFGFESSSYDMPGEDADTPVRARQLESFVDATGAEPFFAWAHFFAPHEPYIEHADTSFGERPIDRYDSEIRWVDDAIGPIIERLLRLRPDTIVVVTADHGEEFGEHGGVYHGTSLFEEQVHVPLIVRRPGVPAGRVAAPVSTASVAATLLEAAGVTIPAGMERPLPGSDAAAAGALAVTENGTTKAIVSGSWKLVTDLRFGWQRHFDLDLDPDEAGESSARPAADLGARLARWMEEQLPERSPRTARDRVLARAAQWDRSTAPAIAAMLENPRLDRTAMIAAARALGRFGSRGQVDVCRRALLSSVPEVRRWCAVSLARCGDRRGLEELRKATTASGDIELAARAAIHRLRLGDRGADLAAAAVLPQVEDIMLGCELTDALATIRSDDALTGLILAYAPLRTRACAARALSAQAHPAAAAFLRFHVVMEPYPEIQHILVEALRRVWDLDTAPALLALLYSPNLTVRTAAARTLTALAEGAQ